MTLILQSSVLYGNLLAWSAASLRVAQERRLVVFTGCQTQQRRQQRPGIDYQGAPSS